MKKQKLLLALLLLSLALSLAACSSGSKYVDGAVSGDGMNHAPSFDAAPMEPGAADFDYDGITSESFPSSAGGGSYYENTKVILTADLDFQTTEFDSAVEALDALVNTYDGYYESSDYSYGGYHSSSSRWGRFNVRVPKENYTAFLAAVGDVAHLISRNTSAQDVGEEYYDAELRLETLKVKHERLLALLDKATIMEDIISLESALSDVEYQIQQYSSTLTRYDGLIDFATIHISLQEVVRVTETPTEKDSLGVRLGAAFSEGWNNFCDGMADFAVWVAYNFIGVLIFLAIVAAVIVVLLRVLRRRRARRYTAPQPPKDNSNSL